MNKRAVFLLTSILWVLIAVGLVISKQHILKTGQPILLETVPVDPRDFLRGDYVILHYKISTLDLTGIKADKPFYNAGANVFVRIEPRGRFWEAVAVESARKKPGKGVYLRGKAKWCYNKKLDIDYGIESYFLPEGEGKRIEDNMRGNKSTVQVEAVVDSSGNALIRKVYVNNNE